MAILSGDIKLVESAVMDDVAEGGGGPTANVIVDGASNNIFPDISETDRAGGRVNLRKVVVHVQTNDRDTFLGGNFIVADPPNDPNVSITVFSTGEMFDTRDEARTRIEAYLNKGAEWSGFLYENHIAGQRVVQLMQRVGSALPVVGQTLALVQDEGLPGEQEQYVRATDVSYEQRTFTYNSGSGYVDYEAWIVTVELSDALRENFTGTAANRNYTRNTNATKVRDTIVADAGNYCGVVPLTAAAELGDYTVSAESVYTQLVPSAQTETPLVDVNPMQQREGFVPTGNTLSFSVFHIFTTTANLFVGGSIQPGTFSLTGGAVTLVDVAGVLYNGGSQVGLLDYENGVASLSTNVFGTGGVTFTVSYTPSAVPRVLGPSLAVEVTIESRSLSYVQTLESVPAPGSLMVSYPVAKRWYVLRDNGQGQLVGSNPGDGAGTVNYTTGTAVVTLGALPDVGGIVLFQWTPGLALNEFPAVELQNSGKAFAELVFDTGVVPETLSLAWNDGSARTATANASGVLSGYATGLVTGATVALSPTVLPPTGTVVTATYSAIETFVDSVTVSLPGTSSGDTFVYDIPDFASGPERLELVVNVQQAVDRIDGVWGTGRSTRKVTLFTVGVEGTTLWASTLGQDYMGGAVVVGLVDWVAGTFALDKEFDLSGSYHDYVNYSGVLHDWWLHNLVPHYVPADGGLPLAAPGRTYTSVVTPGQTETFTITEFKIAPVASVSADRTLESAVFKIGTTLHRQGLDVGSSDKVYADFSPGTGIGTQVGTVSAAGVISLTTWPAASPSVVDWSAVWAPPTPGVNAPYFIRKATLRTAAAPLRPSSLTLTATNSLGVLVSGSTNEAGVISGGITGTVDYDNGIIRLSGTETLDAATLRYNAVSYSYLPLDADLLGIDPVRLPTDGRVPIFRAGGFAVVGHTATTTPATVGNGQTVNLARIRLSRVRVVGADGDTINTGYTTDLEAGTVTFTDVTGYSQPVTIEHRIEDMAVVRDVQISGAISFTRPLTHDFPVPGSYVSSALMAGDLRSRNSVLFDQASWDGTTWMDSVSGAEATGTYNATLAPVQVTNDGAVTERWALRFTSTTGGQIIGEHVGVIDVFSINTTTAPINPATGTPYFTLLETGWGVGWSVGNILRLNTIGAQFPVWVVRTIQQGPEAGIDYSFSLLTRGDVDRP